MSKRSCLCFFLSLLLHNFANASVQENQVIEKKLNDLIGLVDKLSNENGLLRREVDFLKKQRGVEEDIEQIKLVLDSYGKDLTSLRINQGHLQEMVIQHDGDLIIINKHLETNAGQIAGHDQALAGHQTGIEANSGRIQLNTDNINANSGKIQENQNSIIKNSQDIQSVTNNYNSYRNSQVKFLVDTPCCDFDMWPDNSRLTFHNRFLDTHGALTDSQFITPISGFYTFTFTADFRMYDERPSWAFLNVNVNEGLVKSFMYDNRLDGEFFQSYSISTTLILNQGDRVDFSTSGDPSLDLRRNPAVILGYLLIQT